MGYVVREEDSQTGEVTRRGPFVTEQEARLALANAVEQAYDFNPWPGGDRPCLAALRT